VASEVHTTQSTDFSPVSTEPSKSAIPSWSPLNAPAPAGTAGEPLALEKRIQVSAKVVQGIRKFLAEESYVEIPVPMLTPATGSCEVVDSMFTVDYFGQLAFPRQTGQLYLEEIVVRGIPAVYCEGQSLRKEWKVDNRHLTEFKLIEIERKDMTLSELCDLQERLVKTSAALLTAEEIGGVNVTRLDRMIRSEHPRMTYREAIGILRRKGFALEFGDDLGRDAEMALVHHAGQLPIHVTHYPEGLKFFNMKLDRGDDKVVECVDYVLPYSGETFGGSLREPDTAILRQRLYNGTMYEHLMNRAREFARDQWMTKEDLLPAESMEQLERGYQSTIQDSFERYISLFEGVPIERAGFGLGVARLLQYYTGLESIKDAVVFPMDRACFGAMSKSL
jgi:asparaginyl-tRNA synthetase